jgi:uncharacterized protein
MQRRWHTMWFCLLLLPSISFAAPQNATPPLTDVAPQKIARLAIIIDDVGLNLENGVRALAIPGPMTFAILPHRKYSQQLAYLAGRLNKDVMLHAPMSTIRNTALGDGALDESLDESNFKQRLAFSLENTPNIKGMNNHMGSRLTANSQYMQWVMEVLKEKHLFFVDSRTSADSVAYDIAQQDNIPSLRRDIFLDHEVNTAFVNQQFKKAVQIARKYGSAVAIGHPHRVTLDYLNRAVLELPELGVQQVTVSTMLASEIKKRPVSAPMEPAGMEPSLDGLVKQLISKND